MNRLCSEVMDALIAEIEKGVNPWQKSWINGMPMNATTGKYYRGVNVLFLWVSQVQHKFTSQQWGSLRQFGARGLRVKKDELHNWTRVLFFKKLPQKDAGGNPVVDRDGNRRMSGMMRTAWIYNTDQLEEWTAAPLASLSPEERHRNAQATIDRLGIQFSDGPPCFILKHDTVCMPPKDKFLSLDNYYATLFHETVHWTGGPARLNRTFSTTRASKEYAAEELVAEIGSAFLAAQHGIDTSKTDDNSASYLAEWLSGFPDKRAALYTAAKDGSAAFEFVMGGKPEAQIQEAA